MAYIGSAVAEGARVVTGGGRPEGEQFADGFFVAPTVLADVRPDMRVAQEEIFGPVLSVLPWQDEDEVIEAANGVSYGLTGAVWTNDINKAFRVSRAIDSGVIWINGSSQHFPGVPFGGHKNSGTDYEDCIDELVSFTETKSVNVMLKP
jgi:2-formylbenzoate dehydrogenase